MEFRPRKRVFILRTPDGTVRWTVLASQEQWAVAPFGFPRRDVKQSAGGEVAHVRPLGTMHRLDRAGRRLRTDGPMDRWTDGSVDRARGRRSRSGESVVLRALERSLLPVAVARELRAEAVATSGLSLERGSDQRGLHCCRTDRIRCCWITRYDCEDASRFGVDAEPTEQRMRLRYAGTCTTCGTTLAAKAEATYDRGTETVRCVSHQQARVSRPRRSSIPGLLKRPLGVSSTAAGQGERDVAARVH